MAKKEKAVETEEVVSTKQILERGEATQISPLSGKEHVVETTTAVKKEVVEVEGDKERGAHRMLYTEGEPRAADES